MPRASGVNGATITNQEVIFDATEGGPCTTFAVRVRAESANSAAVCVPAMHGVDKVFIPVGETVLFRRGSHLVRAQITHVLAEGVGGQAVIDYWVAADGV